MFETINLYKKHFIEFNDNSFFLKKHSKLFFKCIIGIFFNSENNNINMILKLFKGN